MRDEQEPLRSLDDPSSPEALRRTLSAHAADGPSPAALARMARNLQYAVAPQPPVPAGTSTAPLTVGKAASWLGAFAAVAASGVLWLKLPDTSTTYRRMQSCDS